MEEWKDIKGFDGLYKISSNGRIWSSYKNKRYNTPYMKPYIDSNGYLQIELKNKAYLVHRLVAEHFLEEPSLELKERALKTANKKVLVNHLDGNKQNNNYINLEWCDYSHNSKHSYVIGKQTPRRGEINNKSKLTEMDVYSIKHEYNKTIKNFIQEMKNKYKMSDDAIEDIIYKRTWTHLKD